MKLNFPGRFSKKVQIENFVKIRPVGTELFHAYWPTDGRDEANSRFSQSCEGAKKESCPTEESGLCSDTQLWDRVYSKAEYFNRF
jgi:hypothetical protein